MLISMLLSHVFVDFYLQTDESVLRKTEWKAILFHSLYHFLITLIIAFVLITNFVDALKISSIISITHFAIDFWKQRREVLLDSKSIRFIADQLLHIIIIFLMVKNRPINQSISSISLGKFEFEQIIEFALYALILLKPINIFVRIIFEDMNREFEDLSKGVNGGNGENDNTNGVARGGRFIGIIERVSILLMVLTGNNSFIGYFLGFKVASRWEQIKDTEHFSEKFFVGTLVSLLITILIGMRVLNLLH